MPVRTIPLALLLLPASALIGCANNTSALEARVHELELQVAALRGAQNERAGRPANCIDVTIPPGTLFTHPVAFDIGQTTTQSSDRITITDVQGTRGDFGIGGRYVVRGEYTLASADQADLAFHVTAIDPADGCSYGNPGATQHVTRGSGKFELVNSMPYHGYPHVTFYVADKGVGGIYFGKGDFLLR